MREISESGVRMARPGALSSPSGFTRSRLCFPSALATAALPNKKGPRGGGPGFGSFQLLADAAVDRRNRGGSGAPPLLSVT